MSVRPGAGSRARAAAVHALLARTGARLAGAQVPQIGLVTVAPPPGRAPGAWARELARLPEVEAAQPERYVQPRALAPNDPALTTQENGTPPGTPVQWTLAREGFFDAYPVTRGDGAVVAVIDSGVDASHPEFAGKIKDAVDQDTSRTDGPATVDENGHGTPVAGLACAATDDGVGLAGAGWGCQLLIEKYDATESSIAASIVDATQRGAEAINMSFGDDGSSPAPKPVVDAIGFAFAHDVVLVAAAANADTEEQGSPSNVLQPTGTGPNIDQGEGLDVTAADFSDQRATFGRDAAGNPVRAGRGTQISLAAYGTYGLQGGPRGLFVPFPGQTTQLESGSLVPPEPPCQCRTSFGGDSRYAYLQGTSFAAPQVAALGAMLRHLNPDVPVTGILRAIKETARRPTGTGWSPDLGWGIVNAGAAVQAVRVIDVTPPESHLRAPRRVRSRIASPCAGRETIPRRRGSCRAGSPTSGCTRGATAAAPTRSPPRPARRCASAGSPAGPTRSGRSRSTRRASRSRLPPSPTRRRVSPAGRAPDQAGARVPPFGALARGALGLARARLRPPAACTSSASEASMPSAMTSMSGSAS